MFKSHIYKVYTVKNNASNWIPVLNISLDMYNGRTLEKDISSVNPKCLQKKLSIILLTGEFHWFCAFYFIVTKCEDLSTTVKKKYDLTKPHNEHEVKLSTHFHFIGNNSCKLYFKLSLNYLTIFLK